MATQIVKGQKIASRAYKTLLLTGSSAHVLRLVKLSNAPRDSIEISREASRPNTTQ